jgi:hypothetical protein
MSTNRGVECCSMRRSAVLSALMGMVLIAPAVAQEQDLSDAETQQRTDSKVTIQQIFDVWKSREAAVQSFYCRFAGEIVNVPGSKFGRAMRPLDDSGQSFPAEPLTLQRTHEVFIDGYKFRENRQGQSWWSETESVIDEKYVQVFHDNGSLSYFGRDGQSNEFHPLGFIAPGEGEHADQYSGATSHTIWPIFHTFRINQPKFGFDDAADWRILPETGAVGGRPCLILEQISQADLGFLWRIWVAPDLDYCAVRKQAGRGSMVFAQLDIEYERDHATGVWAPATWSDIYNGEDRETGEPVLISTSTYRMEEFASNPVIDAATFEFVFPPGTEVQDYTGETQTSYIVQDSGTRPIQEEERLRGARYTDLIASPVGKALAPPDQGLIRWWWVAVIAVFIVCGWMVIRRS